MVSSRTLTVSSSRATFRLAVAAPVPGSGAIGNDAGSFEPVPDPPAAERGGASGGVHPRAQGAGAEGTLEWAHDRGRRHDPGGERGAAQHRATGRRHELHEYLEALAKALGIATPTREDLARIDKKRPRKGSNDDWKHTHDPFAHCQETGGMRRVHLRGREHPPAPSGPRCRHNLRPACFRLFDLFPAATLATTALRASSSTGC